MKAHDIITSILIYLQGYIQEGMNLLDIEKKIEALIETHGAKSYNKGYHPKWATTPYPSVACLGVNDDVGHRAPRDYVLKTGDMISVDIGIIKDGQCGDAGFTMGINPDGKDREHLRIAKEACYRGIDAIQAGGYTSSVALAIDKYVRKQGYAVQRWFTGHGIGKEMHEAPQVPMSFIQNFPYTRFEVGQKVCIEPFITKRDWEGELQKDGWSVKTKDGRKCAFFEHEVEVTTEGAKVLTKHFKRGV